MKAEYISSTSFSVEGDQTGILVELRRIRLNCGTDGLKYGTVASSEFGSTSTTVTIKESVITSNLISLKYSIVKPGDNGNEPPDWKQGNELPEIGSGGDFFFKTSDGHIYIYNE